MLMVMSGGEGALLRAAGASEAESGIRNRVDSESAELKDENQPVIDKLLSIGREQEPAATVLNPAKEAERLQQNAQEGKPVTEGETQNLEDLG